MKTLSRRGTAQSTASSSDSLTKDHAGENRRDMHCGWCGKPCTTYHQDWINHCKVCPSCYALFEKHLHKASG